MARLASWRDQIPQSYVGARKWGTGINPVHAVRDGYEGRNLAPGIYDPVDTGLVNYDFGYVDEDYSSAEDVTHMEPHPNLSDPSVRGTSDLPPWGRGQTPVPQGTTTRLRKRGMSWRDEYINVVPNGPAGDGWENKQSGELLNSATADDAQVFVQTSMRQRDEIRTNSAAVTRGTDDMRGDIATRLVGMRLKIWSGGYRHIDMEPKEQQYLPRPWRYRGAGTGDVSWMSANEFQSVDPITREIPPDVYQGRSENVMAGGDVDTDDWFI